MTTLETKIWNLVSNWAEKQYHPINDMALRGLMDEILELVNEESKEEQIKELVEVLNGNLKTIEDCIVFIKATENRKPSVLIEKKQCYDTFIKLLEKILTDGIDNPPKNKE